jgi:purine catabolism regulator
VTGAGIDADLWPVRVRDLLGLDVLQGATTRGGHDGLDHPVEHVHLRTPRSSEPAGLPRSVVIINGTSLGRDGYQVDLALRAAAGVEASAVLLCTTEPELSQATIRLANKLRLPLITFWATDLLDVSNAIYRRVRSQSLVRSDALLDTMRALRRVSGKRGPAAALDAIESALHTPLALVGGEGVVVAGDPAAAPPGTNDLLDVAILSPLADVVHVVQPISLGPGERPSFWLAAKLRSPAHSWQQTVADVLAFASWYVSVTLVADRLARERDARFRLGILNAIIAGQERPEPVLLEQLGVLGWSADGWCTAIHLQASGAVDPLRVLNLSEDIHRHLASAGLRGPFIERPDGWTMWLVDRTEPPLKSYKTTVDKVAAAGQAFAEGALGLRLHAGIGRPYLGLPGLRSSLAEAKEAGTIAQAAGGPFGVQHIDDMGIRRILLGWYASEAFSDFAHTLLAPLLTLDSGAELIHTLETFLNAQSSATLAASQLGVHRNTVLHRISRIRGLLTADLDDPEERLAIQLACRVAKLGPPAPKNA